MKRIALALLLSIIFFTPQLFAQRDMEDVIYLKNGSVYRGDIIEQIPSVSYKIQIMGGSIIYLTASDVQKVVREARYHDPSLRESRHSRPRPRKYVDIETTLSGMLYFNQVKTLYSSADLSGGGGITFLPEFRKEARKFSFLLGLSVQFISVRNFDYTSYDSEPVYGTIYTGFQTRFQVPIWFRWTFPTSTPFFFQFGWSAGFNAYQGRGTETSYGYYSNQNITRNGHVTYTTGSMNIAPMALGIRKELWKQIELIGYVEGALCNLEFMDNNAYKPYIQLHIGFNIHTGKRVNSKPVQHRIE